MKQIGMGAMAIGLIFPSVSLASSGRPADRKCVTEFYLSILTTQAVAAIQLTELYPKALAKATVKTTRMID